MTYLNGQHKDLVGGRFPPTPTHGHGTSVVPPSPTQGVVSLPRSRLIYVLEGEGSRATGVHYLFTCTRFSKSHKMWVQYSINSTEYSGHFFSSFYAFTSFGPFLVFFSSLYESTRHLRDHIRRV